MVYTADTFFTWFTDLLSGVNVFGIGTNYIVIIGLMFVLGILISPRKISNLRVLTLPLMVGLTIIGLPVPALFIGIGVILFVMDRLSTRAIGDAIQGVIHTTVSTGEKILGLPETRQEKKISKVEKIYNQIQRVETAQEKKKNLYKYGTVNKKEAQKREGLLEKLKTDKKRKIEGEIKRSIYRTTDDPSTLLLLKKKKKKGWETYE